MTDLTKAESKQARAIAELLVQKVSAVDAYDADMSLGLDAPDRETTPRIAWFCKNEPKNVSDDDLKACIRRHKLAILWPLTDDEAKLVYVWATRPFTL